eukprot:TRINITY_DN10269_c0_g2_i2.p1 TRINITY_DN10269_c0_g2~~TRINITY_DN10269_c0_g2_i2.p1  ORF type:complete len:189 (+),score=27.73 TRINITY_DN10269_c0_g2_i2:321-887(+)
MSALSEYESQGRRPPNILVCGTPGTGKSSFCEELASRTGFKHLDISQLAIERNLIDEYDDARQTSVIDEDKVIDELDDANDINIMQGGHIVDYHGCDFFPERYFQLVLVLRAENSVLWDRLAARGYHLEKIQENVQAEIMQVVLDEARSSYSEEIVHELFSETVDQMEENLDRTQSWINAHIENAPYV